MTEAMIHIKPTQPISFQIEKDLSNEQEVEFIRQMDEKRIDIYPSITHYNIFCRNGMKQAFEVYALIDKIKNNK